MLSTGPNYACWDVIFAETVQHVNGVMTDDCGVTLYQCCESAMCSKAALAEQMTRLLQIVVYYATWQSDVNRCFVQTGDPYHGLKANKLFRHSKLLQTRQSLQACYSVRGSAPLVNADTVHLLCTKLGSTPSDPVMS